MMRSPPEPEIEVCEGGGRVIRVGDRVRCSGHLATVLFLGRLQGEEGVWLGVHWDEAGRGKHNGCAHGVRYFTSPGDNSASFIRPHKLDASQTCAEAIQKYYGEKEDESTAALHKAVIDDWKKKIKVPFIEMIGFDSVQEKQGTLDKLLEACISDRCIWTGGDLSTVCPSLKVLDLSKNLINSWSIIADIASQLSYLSHLDLSKNRIAILSSNEEALNLSQYFQNLRSLSLTHCEIDWHHVQRISYICQHVQELILASNKIREISPFYNETFLDSLSCLILDNNSLNSWDEVLKLGTLKHLKVLSINKCDLKEIKFDDNYQDEKCKIFVELETLYLKHNLISDWRSISELYKLNNLKKLYMIKNPIFCNMDYDTCSQFIIARTGNLKELNGSEISREVRRGAEYDYIKKHGLQWKQLQNSNNESCIKDFCLHHSRFGYLINKYGLPDENLLLTKKQSWAINSNLLELYLKDESSGVIVKKKLPSTMTVQKLIALARRLFSMKTEAANFSVKPALYVVYINPDNQNEVLVHLESEMKELVFYSVTSGDTILIRW